MCFHGQYALHCAVLSRLPCRTLPYSEGLADDVAGVELLKQIGQGGQGVVFCGLLHGLEVAIKVGAENGRGWGTTPVSCEYGAGCRHNKPETGVSEQD